MQKPFSAVQIKSGAGSDASLCCCQHIICSYLRQTKAKLLTFAWREKALLALAAFSIRRCALPLVANAFSCRRIESAPVLWKLFIKRCIFAFISGSCRSGNRKSRNLYSAKSSGLCIVGIQQNNTGRIIRKAKYFPARSPPVTDDVIFLRNTINVS